MNKPRIDAASAWITDEEWWVTGGFQYENYERMRSTEVYDASTREFEPYVDLPVAANRHNLVNVNETHTVLVLSEAGTELYIFDR